MEISMSWRLGVLAVYVKSCFGPVFTDQVVKFEEASGGRFSVSVDSSDITSKKLPLRKLWFVRGKFRQAATDRCTTSPVLSTSPWKSGRLNRVRVASLLQLRLQRQAGTLEKTFKARVEGLRRCLVTSYTLSGFFCISLRCCFMESWLFVSRISARPHSSSVLSNYL